MIRLLASDVDGTLFNSSRAVSPENRAALARASQSGITVCLASGRLMTTLMPVAAEANVKGPFIACNGAYVESADGEVLMHAKLPAGAAHAVLDYSQRHQVTANVYQPYRVLATHESPMLALYRQRTKAGPEPLGWQALLEEEATKVIFIDEPERNVEHARHFEPLQDVLGFELTVSEPEYLEFLPRGANKGSAIQALAAHMGLQREEVAAIGDYSNDLHMIQWAGLSAAMGSGLEEVKRAADVVVGGNDEHGVAQFVDFILARNNSELAYV